jgi:trehalose/maltose transport system permease protein
MMAGRTSYNSLFVKAGFWTAVGIIVVMMLFPFYWAIVTSLKRPGDLFITPTQYWPDPVTLANYARVLSGTFGRAILNSVAVAGGTVLLSLLIAAPAAYALGKYRIPAKSVIMYTILSVSMFPQIAVLGGLFSLIRSVGLYNTHAGLIFSYLIFTLPFTIWVLTAFVREIPDELEEAAIMDGATPLQILRLVLLPVMAPALVTTGLLAFIHAWNEFLFALTLTVDETVRTVPVAIAMFSGASEHELPWAAIMAASVIVTLPLILLILFFQRRIVSGLTAGAVKG